MRAGHRFKVYVNRETGDGAKPTLYLVLTVELGPKPPSGPKVMLSQRLRKAIAGRRNGNVEELESRMRVEAGMLVDLETTGLLPLAEGELDHVLECLKFLLNFLSERAANACVLPDLVFLTGGEGTGPHIIRPAELPVSTKIVIADVYVPVLLEPTGSPVSQYLLVGLGRTDLVTHLISICRRLTRG